MEFNLDNSLPIWKQLTEQLKARIVTGEYPAGSHFPTVRELAAEAGVNPNTMQRAMAQLEADGLVVTNRTTGRSVTDDMAVIEQTRKNLAMERIDCFLRDMQSLGYDSEEAIRLADGGKR